MELLKWFSSGEARECFGSWVVQDVKEFVVYWLTHEPKCLFILDAVGEHTTLSGQLVCSYGHIWSCVHGTRTAHLPTHTEHTHARTPLFALLAKWKLLSESDWNLYQFVRRKPKMILLHIILISLVPEIEKKWRKEGGKYPTPRTPDKCRSQDSSRCSISKCSTWPSKK